MHEKYKDAISGTAASHPYTQIRVIFKVVNFEFNSYTHSPIPQRICLTKIKASTKVLKRVNDTCLKDRQRRFTIYSRYVFLHDFSVDVV